MLGVSWFVIDWTDEGTETYPGGVVLRDASGDILRVSLGPGDVDCRPFYSASPDDWIVKALVAAEDGTYWTHHGVRPLSVLRAFAQNVFSRRRVSGASTISMQTVRLIRPHRKSYAAKYAEAFRALKMERKKDKLWILSQYLNRVPLGANFVGIEAAANGWFGKGAKELGIGEAAMLAGMVQAPSRFRPDRGYERAFKRRDYVLERMLKLGYITAEERDWARSVRPVVSRTPRPFKTPFFCDWVESTDACAAARSRGGDVRTTLDADVQRTCEAFASSAAAAGGYSVAAVVMKADSGAVLALACSGDYFNPTNGQVVTACSPRPAGSTLKPFLSALALDRGLVTPEERLEDSPVSYRGYRPANFDGRYRGPVTLRDSLVLSLNVPFVRLLDRVGVGTFGAYLRDDLGFAHLGVRDEEAGLGMAIGNVEVSLLELVAAYGTFARGGEFRPPEWRAGVVRDGVRVCSSAAAYLVSDMLSGTERSDAALGHVADVAVPRFAWKTGTSSAYRDAWTVLWNPEYVIGVWCGHLAGGFGDKTLVGATAAAPVAWGIARTLYPGDGGPWFAEPEGIVRRRICSVSGLPANPDCPATEEGRAIRGVSSALLCSVHRHDRPEAAGGGAERLRILSPTDGAEFVRVSGTLDQRIVCRVAGNGPDVRLWWTVDGVAAGESVGNAPFAVKMTEGRHAIVCATASGGTAEVVVDVRR